VSAAPTGPVLVTGCSSGIGRANAQGLLATRTLGGDRAWDFMIRQQFKG
jgi:NAD(P)-dependent dehydrogenase (short-subunit alcohol dehydrogenase family)